MSWEEELARYEEQGCLHEMFERQADITPDVIAVVDDDNRSLTYAELNEACNVLADNLVTKGVTCDSPVGIYMERCIEYVISYIAILKAGGAYMPLDPSYPMALLEDIFKDSQPPCVITNSTLKQKLEGNSSGQTVITLEDNWMETLKKENREAGTISRSAVTLDNLACIVYSSGTTGKPKGIMNPHRSPVFSYTWRHATCPFREGDRVACNVFFVWEVLRPLLKGYPVYIIPDSVIYDPLLLSKFIKRHSITRILFTPSLLETVMDASNLSMNDFASIRIIWFCGEVVTTSLLDRCVANLPWIKFYNLYSISECHDVAVSDLNEFLELENLKMNAKRPKFAPVGKVCPGIHVVIMDEDHNLQPVGMPGEIFVGGPTLSRGYLKRPDMNKKRFIKTPEFLGDSVGPRLYRTGDWGSMKSDRNLEICGRCDSMVKIRGYSIEVQAVEAALMGLDEINSCVVMTVGAEGDDKQLVAYVVLERPDVTKKMIKAELRRKLPFYMIPSYIIFLQSLPVLPSSGKLDKKALPSIHQKRQSEAGMTTLAEGELPNEDRTVPNSDTERFLEKAWCEILQLDVVDVQESFFDLGGHSLLAARLLGKIRERFDNDVTMQSLFANPTILELARWLDNGKEGNQTSLPKLDLHNEVKLHGTGLVNIDMQLRAFWRSHGFGYKSRRARVLLTGATGFLGAYILRELLLETKVQVYCLVRRSPDKSAEQRLLDNLEFYDIFKSSKATKDVLKAYKKRVHAMSGDVALFELGLTEEDYTYLSYEIDYVIHAAAYVNLLYPYEALKGANVTGTHNVMMFARAGKIKPLHYVSTNSVYPNNNVMCKECSTADVDTSKLSNGYSQSKWVAEQMVLSAVGQGLPATIYRIGNISGHSETAGWNPADFILLVLRASLMTSSWPDVEWNIEMTPVDFISRCIVQFSQDLQTSVHKIFHIVQPNGVSGRWMYDWLNKEFGYNLELVPLDTWCTRVEEVQVANGDTPKGHPDVRKMLESVTSTKDESLFSYNTTFDQTNLQAAAKSLGLSYPEVDGKLIKTYILELIKRKVVSPPIQSKEGTLNGRVAVITGASSGIGRSVAIHLANAGAKVCVAARSVDKLEELKNEIEKDGGTVSVFQCDVTKREQVQQLISHTEALWGSVDILVNNAGVMYYTYMSSCLMDHWDRTIEVNCKGVTNGVGAVLPGMIKRNRGHIINMSSDAGILGFAGLAVYSGTKFFVEGLSQALRHEVVDKGIKVTCIEPGDVKTNIFEVVIDEEARAQYETAGKAKILDPDDIARAVLYAVTQPDHVAVNRLLVEPRELPI